MDRRRELAILRTVGVPGGTVAAIFLLEVLAAAGLGLLLGMGVAVALEAYLGRADAVATGCCGSRFMGDALRAGAGLLVAGLAGAALPLVVVSRATVAELLGERTIPLRRRRPGAGRPQ